MIWELNKENKMNYIVDDYGKTVIAIGAPGSVERAKVQYPKLIDNLNALYFSAYESPGRAVDEAIEKIRAAGINSPLETKSVLQASNYANEPSGSVTSLTLSASNKKLSDFFEKVKASKENLVKSLNKEANNLTKKALFGPGFAEFLGSGDWKEQFGKDIETRIIIDEKPIVMSTQMSGDEMVVTVTHDSKTIATYEPEKGFTVIYTKDLEKYMPYKDVIERAAKKVYERGHEPKHPKPVSEFSGSVRDCHAGDITWGGLGYQCLNCGATADHSWNIKHKKQRSASLANNKLNNKLEVVMAQITEDDPSIKKEIDFYYFINLDERGEFYADVRIGDVQGYSVFDIHGGDIFEDGFMKNKEDLQGLKEYLVYLGIMKENQNLKKGN